MKFAHEVEPDPPAKEQSRHWSLSWKPEGYCDKFTRDAILACAPAASGVYGLFNFDCQIFIGESANIREVLLRLEREADFLSELLRPTGFTFELCSEESRKQKASELIARYRPTLQTIAASNELDPNEPLTGTTEMPGSTSGTPAENHELPSQGKPAPQTHSHFQFKRAYAAVLLAMLLSAGAATYHFTPISDVPSHKTGTGDQSSASVPGPQVLTSNQAGNDSKPPETSTINPSRERAKLDDEETPVKANSAVRLVKASSADDSTAQKVKTSASLANGQGEKKWSVQIASVPTKDAADRLMQALVAGGYDSYVVEAEVKGQAYYRVRAGRFGARGEAEAMRDSLMRQEGYRDAYVTGD